VEQLCSFAALSTCLYELLVKENKRTLQVCKFLSGLFCGECQCRDRGRRQSGFCLESRKRSPKVRAPLLQIKKRYPNRSPTYYESRSNWML